MLKSFAAGGAREEKHRKESEDILQEFLTMKKLIRRSQLVL